MYIYSTTCYRQLYIYNTTYYVRGIIFCYRRVESDNPHVGSGGSVRKCVTVCSDWDRHVESDTPHVGVVGSCTKVCKCFQNQHINPQGGSIYGTTLCGLMQHSRILGRTGRDCDTVHNFAILEIIIISNTYVGSACLCTNVCNTNQMQHTNLQFDNTYVGSECACPDVRNCCEIQHANPQAGSGTETRLCVLIQQLRNS